MMNFILFVIALIAIFYFAVNAIHLVGAPWSAWEFYIRSGVSAAFGYGILFVLKGEAGLIDPFADLLSLVFWVTAIGVMILLVFFAVDDMKVAARIKAWC